MQNNLKKILYRQRVNIAAAASFMLPLVIYILTLERKVIGGDTTWYALKLPEMQVMVPTGYPAFSIIGKVFSMLPFADLAYRLNLISAIFGALTILFLFLAMVKLSNNVPASLASSLIFAFIFTYWSVASRLEFDTINSFFLALIFYSAFLYAKNPQRKYLYFFAAAAGLGLTNHPILLFVLPAIIIYVIIANPRTLKSIKAILFSILFFILPLSLYMWLPIRSLQGYGPVTTFKSLVYYVTRSI